MRKWKIVRQIEAQLEIFEERGGVFCTNELNWVDNIIFLMSHSSQLYIYILQTLYFRFYIMYIVVVSLLNKLLLTCFCFQVSILE